MLKQRYADERSLLVVLPNEKLGGIERNGNSTFDANMRAPRYSQVTASLEPSLKLNDARSRCAFEGNLLRSPAMMEEIYKRALCKGIKTKT